MSATRRRKPPARPTRRRRSAPVRDFWGHDTNEDRVPDPIRPSDDPATLIQSLGPPPLPGGEAVAEHYFAATYQKAASLAIALAAASDLLETDDPDD
jgi:hypothetical protein